jgi:hypothetical protein
LGKSTFGAQLAAYIWKKFGKKTRVVNADGGGTVNAHAPLIEAGISEVWDIDRWDESSMFYTLDCASKGWWPIDVNEPNSPLVAPQRSWKECPACKGDVGAQGFNLPKACKSCKTPLAAGTFCRTKHETTEAFSAVGSVIFEGMSAFGELLLRRLRTVNAEGGRTIMDAGYKISAPGLSHFGDAQTYIAQYVANSKNIPTELVYWTALENKGEDDGKPIYGPKGPGQALTPMCIPWFSDVLHLDAIPRIDRGTTLKDANGVEIVDRKLFLAPHFPSDNKIYAFMAKTSVPLAGKMPSVIDFPADGNTAEKFMTALAEAKRRAAEEMLK